MKRVAMLALVVMAASCVGRQSPDGGGDGGGGGGGGGGTMGYTVTGAVTGPGLADAVLTLQKNGVPMTATTSAEGGYQFLDVPAGDYTLSVEKTGFAYTPSSQIVQVDNADVKVSDITSAVVQRLSAVSGTVTGYATVGVLLTLSKTDTADSTTLTTTGGVFRLDGVADGTYTLTPTLAGYTFTPTSREVIASGTAVTGQDFTSAAVPNAVIGKIIGDAKAGVTLTLVGTAGTFTSKSDALGSFAVAASTPGTYTLTPSLDGYAFFPTSRTVTVALTAVPGQDFAGLSVGWKMRPVSGSSKRWYSIVARGNGKYLAAVAYNDSLYTSSDYGFTWGVKSSLGVKDWQSVNMSDDGKYLALSVGYNAFMFLSDNYGVDLKEINSGIMSTKRSWQNIAMSRDGKLLATVAFKGHVYTSSDYGEVWNDKSSGVIASDMQWYSIAMSDDGTRLAAVVNEGLLYMSNNSGTTWQSVSSGIMADPKLWRSIAMSSNGAVLAAIDKNYLYVSRDSGVTWARKSTGFIAGEIPWSSVAMSSDGKFIALVANKGKVYVSENSGDTWQIRYLSAAGGDMKWTSVTISDDGRFLAAVAYDGDVYTYVSE